MYESTSIVKQKMEQINEEIAAEVRLETKKTLKDIYLQHKRI